MKRGDTFLIRYLRHGTKAPKGSRLIPMLGNHGHYSSLAILPQRKPKKARRA